MAHRVLPEASFSLLEEVPETRTGDFLDALLGAATDDEFVVLDQSSSDYIWTTTDGTSWEQHPTSGLPDSAFFNGIATMDNRIVIIGGASTGQFAYFSDDGATWKKADAPFSSSSSVDSITAGPTGWFISGTSSNTKPSSVSADRWAPPPALWVSTDGATWKSIGLPDDVFGLEGIPLFDAPGVGTDRIIIAGTEMTDFSNGSTGNPTRVFYLATTKP
jgi:photosystem II stability/assembly factor-like uncharacterized protein